MRLSIFYTAFILLFTLLFSVEGCVAGVEDELSEIKKDLSEVKRDVQEIKKILTEITRPPQPQEVKVDIDDDPLLGNAGAPLTLIEFSDYQCPFCSRFSRETLPRIKKEYVDTGKVRYVFRDYPLPTHKEAPKAAEAANCAGDQGKYWQMHNRLFEQQSKISLSDLKNHAKDMGLNMEQFGQCLDSGKYIQEVQKDFQDGQKAGVGGTPTFFIGKTTKDGKITSYPIRGAQPFEAFKTMIEEMLRQ